MNQMNISDNAGLVLSVENFVTMLRAHGVVIGNDENAFVFYTAVIEYIAAEILFTASNSAQNDGSNTINARHIIAAISQDEELSILLLNRRQREIQRQGQP